MGLDPILARYKEIMERNRWAVVGIMPTTPTNPPPWAYTVGLSQYGYPELVMTGLAPTVAQPILNLLAARMLDDYDFRPAPGDDLHDVISGDYPLRVVAVSDENVKEYLKVAVSLLPTPPCALQIVWPGPTGEWPWESDHWGAIQPVLRLPASG